MRKKVIEVLDTGVSVAVVAAQFHLGKRTVYEWQQRYKQTGDFGSKKPGNIGYNHKIIDWEAFKIFAQEHGSQNASRDGQSLEGSYEPSNYS